MTESATKPKVTFAAPNRRDPGDRINLAMSERQIEELLAALEAKRANPLGPGTPHALEVALRAALARLVEHNAFGALC